MRRAVDIARKLELTSIALGCLTRKELCRAFARVNPNTAMTLQNSYNWQSGRSVPRSFGVFVDWAAAIGIAEGPHFVMSSSLGEFVRALGERFALPQELLAAYTRPPPAAPAAAAPEVSAEAVGWGEDVLAASCFLGLSHSWSPVHRGFLLSGVLETDTGSGGITASYRETVLGRTIRFTGSGRSDGRTCQLTLQCEANGGLYLMAFHLPVLAGNLGGGIFAGNALYDPDTEPTGSVLLLLRNHDLAAADLLDQSVYMAAEGASLAVCLERLGYGRDPGLVAEHAMLRLLAGGADGRSISARRDDICRAAILLDRRRFEASGRA